MGAFQSVPDDVLTGTLTSYVVGIPYHIPKTYKKKLLVLRTTCKDGRELVRRIVADQNRFRTMCHFFRSEQDNSAPVATEPREMRVSARHVEAVSRVFGGGCTALFADGRSPERIAALEFFVSRATRLDHLDVSNTEMSPEVLLRMCRAAPRLEQLTAPKFMETSDDTILAVSVACPLLKHVRFSRLGRESGEYSPVETWARLFPQLQEFNLHGGRWVGYEPTRIEAIHECALSSKARIIDLDACHITANVIEAIVGTPLGDRIEMLGCFDYPGQDTTNIEPAAFLAAARGFPKLTDIHIPKGSTMGGPGFYVDLSRLTTILTTLEIYDEDTTDACVAAACQHLRLTHLALSGCPDLTSFVVESITGGQAAATLTSLTIKHCAQEPDSNPLRAVDVLRLLTGCPDIDSFSWFCDRELHEYAELDEGPCKAIVELLAGRVEEEDCGVDCFAGDWNEIDYPDEPDCIFE